MGSFAEAPAAVRTTASAERWRPSPVHAVTSDVDRGLGPQSAYRSAAGDGPDRIRRGGVDRALTLTRAPDGPGSEEDVTASDGGAAPAVPAPPVAAPAAVTTHCKVATGPSYTPTGTIPATVSGGRKKFPFSMAATFTNLSPAATMPACCSVRQYIKWDQRYVDSKGGPPHSGFPASTPVDTWIEDRDSNDKRYGHRSGPHSDPIAGGGDEYTTGGQRDQATGDTYAGRDTPQAPVSRTGTWQFRLDVIDTCNGNAVKASSPVITVAYG